MSDQHPLNIANEKPILEQLALSWRKTSANLLVAKQTAAFSIADSWFLPWIEFKKNITDFLQELEAATLRMEALAEFSEGFIDDGSRDQLIQMLKEQGLGEEKLARLRMVFESADEEPLCESRLQIIQLGESTGESIMELANRWTAATKPNKKPSSKKNSKSESHHYENDPKFSSLHTLLQIEQLAYQFALLNNKDIPLRVTFKGDGIPRLKLEAKFDEPRLLAKFFGDGEYLELLLDLSIRVDSIGTSKNPPKYKYYSRRCLECGNVPTTPKTKVCGGSCQKQLDRWIERRKGSRRLIDEPARARELASKFLSTVYSDNDLQKAISIELT